MNEDGLYVCLDYDEVAPKKVIREALALREMFQVPLSIYKTSQGCFHIRFKKKLPRDTAFEVLDYSTCSEDYKAYCREVGRFPYRTTAKVIRNSKGRVIKRHGPPQLVCNLSEWNGSEV